MNGATRFKQLLAVNQLLTALRPPDRFSSPNYPAKYYFPIQETSSPTFLAPLLVFEQSPNTFAKLHLSPLCPFCGMGCKKFDSAIPALPGSPIQFSVAVARPGTTLNRKFLVAAAIAIAIESQNLRQAATSATGSIDICSHDCADSLAILVAILELIVAKIAVAERLTA